MVVLATPVAHERVAPERRGAAGADVGDGATVAREHTGAVAAQVLVTKPIEHIAHRGHAVSAARSWPPQPHAQRRARHW